MTITAATEAGADRGGANLPRVLLANELGAGRGHVVSLTRVARALGAGLPRLAALGAMRYAHELRAEGVEVRRAPQMRFAPEMAADPTLVGTATWACYLAASGVMRDDLLRESLAYWRRLIVEENISILVADYAPLAQRAALALRDEGWEIRLITLGTGYGVPPATLERFPQLSPTHDRRIHPEAEVLAQMNRIGAELGLAPLPRLSAIYQADLAMPATFDFLDPHAEWRPAAALTPPLIERSASTAAGDEVFVYFSRREPDEPELLRALEHLPLPRRGYLPAASDETRARLAAAGMIIETAPVPAALTAARSRMVLHNAPHGSICTAALAGLPQLGLASNKEQLVHGRRAEAAGILHLLPLQGASAAQITEAACAVYEDAARREVAQAMAARLRADFPADPMEDLARRLAPEVAAAAAFVTA